jgi:hypothetical protein
MFTMLYHGKIYLYLIVVCCSIYYTAMAMEQQTFSVGKEIKASYLQLLPQALLQELGYFLTSASSVDEAIQNITKVPELINNPTILGIIIEKLNARFNKNAIDIALAFFTPSAAAWLKGYLQLHPQDKDRLNKLLQKAVEKNNIRLLRFALNAGADVNMIGERGWTPLSSASNDGYKDIVELLVKVGADVNQIDKFGNTPLHEAASSGYKDIVDILLKAGANVKAINPYWGHTPLGIARHRNHKEIEDLLVQKLGTSYPIRWFP